MKSMTRRFRPIATAVALAVTGFAVQAGELSSQDSFPVPEMTPADYYQAGAADVAANAKLRRFNGQARNIILFVGDGMGVSTVTAARILAGQLEGVSGEENKLAFEEMPWLALSKTYSANQMTSDSAPTMTAMVAGYKTNEGVLSIDHEVPRNTCDVSGHEVKTILEMAEEMGKSTGIISTARITHATPAANYSHISNRDWESNRDVAGDCVGKTTDIAAQLVELGDRYGDGIEVVMGGGRRAFLPNTLTDSEGSSGRRTDGRNLPDEWIQRYGESNDRYVRGEYLETRAEFDALMNSGKRFSKKSHVLALFNPSHMQFEEDRADDVGGEPSLSEMTEAAINILKSNNRDGFYLQVEAGRIDHAHHAGNAYRALSDTIELAKAVRVAMENTDPRNTLIIVTADHSHNFTIAGYPKRGNNIMGRVIDAGGADGDYSLATDGQPYTVLAYTNGLGFYNGVPGEDVYALPARSGRFYNFSDHAGDSLGLTATTDPDYHQEALVPTSAETHAGEDVAIYAWGTHGHLFQNTMEQSSIFHVMRAAMFKGKE